MSTCSYCGRENEPSAANCYECGTAFPVHQHEESAPSYSAPRLIVPERMRAAFTFEDGFHRADWDLIRQWIEANISPAEQEEAWNESALLWVETLRDDLGGDYFVLQSHQTILLCDLDDKPARLLLHHAGSAADTIKEYLGEVAWHGAQEKDVVLVFSDEDDFYQFVSHRSPDGEQAAMGGVCIHDGYTHIAMPWWELAQAKEVIVHELAHDCVTHLPLPCWLNEGLAMTLQRRIVPQHSPLMWHELAERHFAFWTEKNMQSFWAGPSFHEAGDASELSYSLAEVLVKLLGERGDDAAFRNFLLAAQWADAGQTAALDVLQADLGEIAGTFLGAGNWRPQRLAMLTEWKIAGWNETS